MSWRLWLMLCLSVCAHAQDPFEIQVFEYDPLPRGAFTYEAHTNYVAEQQQVHLSSEVTAGLTDGIRAGLVVLTGSGPGMGMQYAGFRVLPHFYAPPSWRLPLNLGFVPEFSFERAGFDEDTRYVELRGIVEKHVGRLQLDGNAVFQHALSGSSWDHGWKLEPSGRIGWKAWRTITPSVEYYGSLGPIAHFLPARQQIEVLFGGWAVVCGHATASFIAALVVILARNGVGSA